MEAARRRVALSLLISEVIKHGRSEGRSVARCWRASKNWRSSFRMPTQALQTYRSNPQIQRQMEAAVLEDQVVDWVLERAKVTRPTVDIQGTDEFRRVARIERRRRAAR